MDKSECTRKWTSEGGKTVFAHSKACLFCDHCTDIFWDYTNGPYMICCELELDSQNGFRGECPSFKEDK